MADAPPHADEKAPVAAAAAAAATTATAQDDVALAVVGELAQDIDPVVEARVLRKIDLFLIPAMIVGYGMVYYDKAILGSASLFGMTTDLNLSVTDTSTTPPTVDTTRLSWATSIFYFGMLGGLYPMTFALQRFTLSRVLAPLVLLWALVCMLTAAVTTYRGLYIQRFFLGFIESAIPPAFMTLITSYYTPREQSLRQSWWFSSTGLFTIVGGAMNYGFAQITSGALKRWQYIYILAGCLTVLFAAWCAVLPSSPATAWFLTAEERVVGVERLRRGRAGVRCEVLKAGQVREGLLDVKTWLIFVMMAAAYTTNGAVSGFGPLIVKTFGWSTLHSILFQFPLGALCLITILGTGWAGSRWRDLRIVMLVVNCLPVIAGCAVIWRSKWTYRAAAPVVGYSIIGTFGAVVSLVITLGMSNVAGHTKKSFMAATIFVAYCVGNIVGPQLIKSQTKERHYPMLWLGLIISYCITIVCAGVLYAVLWRENRRRDAMELDVVEGDKLAFRDLTDKENLHFRYVL